MKQIPLPKYLFVCTRNKWGESKECHISYNQIVDSYNDKEQQELDKFEALKADL